MSNLGEIGGAVGGFNRSLASFGQSLPQRKRRLHILEVSQGYIKSL
jgi:hypothetical protein